MKRTLLICLLCTIIAVLVCSQFIDAAGDSGRQRFRTESLGMDVINIPLRDGTKSIFIAPHSHGITVYSYIADTIADSIRMRSGTGASVYVAGRDSVCIVRRKMTRVTWLKNPSYSEAVGLYMNTSQWKCGTAHSDTLIDDTSVMTYSVAMANSDTTHDGHAYVFRSLCVSAIGPTGDENGGDYLSVSCWRNGEIASEFYLASNDVFETDEILYDSLRVVANGNISSASYTVTWDHGNF